MTKIHWTIVRTNLGWRLRCSRLTNKEIVTVAKYEFKTFIDAIRAASILQVHLDNETALPFKQYRKGA